LGSGFDVVFIPTIHVFVIQVIVWLRSNPKPYFTNVSMHAPKRTGTWSQVIIVPTTIIIAFATKYSYSHIDNTSQEDSFRLKIFGPKVCWWVKDYERWFATPHFGWSWSS